MGRRSADTEENLACTSATAAWLPEGTKSKGLYGNVRYSDPREPTRGEEVSPGRRQWQRTKLSLSMSMFLRESPIAMPFSRIAEKKLACLSWTDCAVGSGAVVDAIRLSLSSHRCFSIADDFSGHHRRCCDSLSPVDSEPGSFFVTVLINCRCWLGVRREKLSKACLIGSGTISRSWIVGRGVATRLEADIPTSDTFDGISGIANG